MSSARDVAAYLERLGVRDRLELQKLLYYAQAWHLAWEGVPLFPETIRAWDRGPVVGEVWYELSRGGRAGDAERLVSVEDELTFLEGRRARSVARLTLDKAYFVTGRVAPLFLRAERKRTAVHRGERVVRASRLRGCP